MLELQDRLHLIPQAPFPAHSRIHRLRSFPGTFYVKRDDELGFTTSGSKIRKYRTLIPYLINAETREAIVIGSAYSSHVLSFTLLLIENGILPKLFLRGNPSRELLGNALLTSLTVPKESIRWFSKTAWKQVHEEAQREVDAQKHKTIIIEEGGSIEAALPGMLTLPLDIIQNEHEQGFAFDHLFIESGSGLMAISTLLCFSFIEKSCLIHVILLAGDENYFLSQLKRFHAEFERLLGKAIPLPQNYILYPPKETGRFGYIQESIYQNIATFAQQEGIFTDPIYTSKLFKEARSIAEEKSLKGNILINHSGGGLSLMGFQKQLQGVN